MVKRTLEEVAQELANVGIGGYQSNIRAIEGMTHSLSNLGAAFERLSDAAIQADRNLFMASWEIEKWRIQELIERLEKANK